MIGEAQPVTSWKVEAAAAAAVVVAADSSHDPCRRLAARAVVFRGA